MEGLKIHIEPDFIYVDNDEELIVKHEITNRNLFPIIFRVNFLGLHFLILIISFSSGNNEICHHWKLRFSSLFITILLDAFMLIG